MKSPGRVAVGSDLIIVRIQKMGTVDCDSAVKACQAQLQNELEAFASWLGWWVFRDS